MSLQEGKMKILSLILLSLMFLSCASAEYDKYLELQSKCIDEYNFLRPLCRGDRTSEDEVSREAYRLLYDSRSKISLIDPNRGGLIVLTGDSLRYKAELKERATEFASVCKPWLDWMAKYEHKNNYGREENACSRGLVKAMEKGKQDSIENENLALAKKKSYDEIDVLIANGAETSLVLDKCGKHTSEFNEKLQKCVSITDSIALQEKIDKNSTALKEKIDKITELLKANELEKCINECRQTDLRYASPDVNEKISDLCEKQLSSKVKKLPPKKITSPDLAKIYYGPIQDDNMFPYTTPSKNTNVLFTGKVIQNTGKMAILTHPSDTDFMVKHSGQCILRENQYFQGYGKYIGETTYTTIFGQRTVPTVQLLWCPQ
jgi:hypothetical protein